MLGNNCPIVFAFDDNFFECGYVAIKSMIDNCTSGSFLKIFILYSDLSIDNIELLKTLSDGNVEFNFIKMDDIVKSYAGDLILSPQWTVTTYYRLWIPQLFKDYKRVIYLDSDLIVQFDITEFMQLDIGNNYVAAVIDQGIASGLQSEFSRYLYKALNTNDLSEYFNAGILIMNIEELIKFDFFNTCMKVRREIKNPGCADQDVLNVVCQGKVFFMDWVNNAQTVFFSEYGKNLLPDFLAIPENIEFYNKYLNIFKNAKIIHYTSGDKPWTNPGLKYADRFWAVARNTPVYESIIYSALRKDNNCKSNLRGKIKYSFWEKIFSLKNQGKHKVICLLGMKLKIKRKK